MRNSKILIGLLVLLAGSLIAAGCGGDDETTATEATDAAAELTDALTDLSVPESAQEAQEQAEQALEDAPENIDQAVQQCKDGVEQSGLTGDAKQSALDLCESSGDAASKALESLGE